MKKVLTILCLILPLALLIPHSHADSGSASGSAITAGSGSSSGSVTAPPASGSNGITTSPGATDASGSAVSSPKTPPVVTDPTDLGADKAVYATYGIWGLMAIIGALCMWAVAFSEREGWLSANSKPVLILTAVGGVLTSFLASKYGSAPWMMFLGTLVIAAKTLYSAFHAGAAAQAKATS